MKKLLYIILILVFATVANAALLFEGPFTSDEVPFGTKSSGCCENPTSKYYENAYECDAITSAGAISPRAGTHFMRSYTLCPSPQCNEGNPGHYRSEIVPKDLVIEVGTEYWVGISVFIPADFPLDISNSVIIWQTHNNNWDPVCEDAEHTMALPLNLWLDEGGTYRIHVSNGGPNGSSYDLVYNESFADDRGKWVDWAFNFKFSDTVAGFVKVYKNKNPTPVVDVSGKNYRYGDIGCDGNYQFGLYTWSFRENPTDIYDEYTMYHDEFRVGDANSSLAEVSPQRVVVHQHQR